MNNELKNNVKITRLPLKRFRGVNKLLYIFHYLRFFLYSMVVVTRKWLRNRYEIIHVHNMPEFLVFSAAVPKIFGAKIILDMHDLMPEVFTSKSATKGIFWYFLIFVESISTRFADFVIGVHEFGNQILVSRGVPKNKLIDVMNVPDEKVFFPRPFIRDKEFTLIYHGIIAKRQGIDILLQSLNRLLAKGMVIKLLLIGEGDHLPEIRELVNELKLQDAVQIIEPFVPTAEIPSYLQRVHVGVLPYRENEITQLMLPVKLLEYVSMEIPVIASRLKVMDYFFNDSMIFFVPSEDIQALANAIEEVYYSEELRKELSRNASRFLLEHNWDTERRKLFSVYKSLYQD
jgi:glycosyltransferase involved in cell wall biosynthesis